MANVIAKVLVGLGGLVLAVTVGASALRSVVLPRGVPSPLTGGVLGVVRGLFQMRLGRAPSYEKKDRVLAPLAPVALIALLMTWLVLYWFAFACMQWATSPNLGFSHAIALSGSSLLTLGTVPAHGPTAITLSYVEASAGLISTALLISYLPTLYGAFSRREAFVSKLQVRAGDPPTGTELLRRAWSIGRLDRLTKLWDDAESFFVELEESHISYPMLSFFRSPQPEQSWTTASGAILDGAALRLSVVDLPREIEASLAIRSGFLALRGIATYFAVDVDPDPSPTDPISVTRTEFDAACRELEEGDVPLKADREQAWLDFAGWRVNYDVALLALTEMTSAPYAPWSSDRTLADGVKARMTKRRRASRGMSFGR